MPRLRSILRALGLGGRRRGAPTRQISEPGRSGPYATADTTDEVGSVTMTYNPDTDGDPDPGEVVWTWVPYEEDPTQGKDRPVLIVAREPADTLLGVQLSSQDRNGDPQWVAVGSGGWDAGGRESWADITRVLRVHPRGMRREGAALAQERFDQVAGALRNRYGWRLRT